MTKFEKLPPVPPTPVANSVLERSTINDVPVDVTKETASYLDVASFAKLGCVDTEFRKIFDDQDFRKSVIKNFLHSASASNLSDLVSRIVHAQPEPQAQGAHAGAVPANFGDEIVSDMRKYFATNPSPEFSGLPVAKQEVVREALLGLRELDELDLSGTTEMTTLPAELSLLPNLKSIDLTGCTNLSNIRALSSLKKMRSVDISECNVENTDALRNLSELRIFYAADCPRLVDINSLSSHPSLSQIDIRGSSNIRDIQLTDIPSLGMFCAPDCDSLRSVSIDGDLGGLANLELRQSENLSRVSLPNSLPSLEKVDVSYCRNLRDLDFLQGAENLDILELVQCPGLQQVDAVVALHRRIDVAYDEEDLTENVRRQIDAIVNY